MLMNISKKIELVANVAIIVVACLFAIAFTKNYLLTKPVQQLSKSESQNEAAPKPSVSSLDINWKQNGQTLILAISTTCHFCTESAPFYKKLAQRRGDTHLIALFPQSAEEGRKYLKGLGVAVDEVRESGFDTMGVRGTPTLLLIDSTGLVKDSWVGKLSSQAESKVLTYLSEGQ